ncbi:hypothetical protein FGB62_3g438 [Gracilaria domingensis]|nr:hypothetical protein FGB62_3g438 [Gracilaria domingensis]
MGSGATRPWGASLRRVGRNGSGAVRNDDVGSIASNLLAVALEHLATPPRDLVDHGGGHPRRRLALVGRLARGRVEKRDVGAFCGVNGLLVVAIIAARVGRARRVRHGFLFGNKTDHVLDDGHAVVRLEHAVRVHGGAHGANGAGEVLQREVEVGVRHGGARLIERAQQRVHLANVVNGELERLGVRAHVGAKAAGGGGAGVDDAVHLAHLGKGLVETVEVLLGDKLAVDERALEVDVQDAQVVGQHDGAAQKGGGGVATDAERVGGKDAVPGGGGDLEREEHALARAEAVHLLDADEVVVTGDEGEMAGRERVGAEAAAQLLDDVAQVLLGVVAVALQDELEVGHVDARLLAHVAEEGVARGGLGDGAVVVQPVAAREADDVRVERAPGNLLDQREDALCVLDRELVADEVLAEHDDDVGGGVQVAQRRVLGAVQVVVVDGADVQQVGDALGELVQTGQRAVWRRRARRRR